MKADQKSDFFFRLQLSFFSFFSFFIGGEFLSKKFLMQQTVRFPRFVVSIRA